MSNIKIFGCVNISLVSQKPTLGDVREWLNTVSKTGLSDDTELLEGYLSIDAIDTETELINCGDICNTEDMYVKTHKCKSNKGASNVK